MTDKITTGRPAEYQTFEEFHADYYPIMIRYLSKIAGKYIAEDIAQQAMLTAYRNLPRIGQGNGQRSTFNGPLTRKNQKLSSWMYSVATNLYRSFTRRIHKMEYLDSESPYLAESPYLDLPAESAHDSEYESQEIESVIKTLLDDASAGAGGNIEIFLASVENTRSSIAEKLRISMTALRSRIHRGRRKMRSRVLKLAKKRNIPEYWLH